MLFNRRSHLLLTEENALPGRSEPITVSEPHFVLGTPLTPPFPEGIETVIVAMGCFWGAERAFWRVPGVYTTAVGYAGGFTANPTYEEVCTGRTGHTEAVLVAFDPAELPFEELLKVFWEQHDPTQLNRQGNDVGTQYRSAIFWTAEEQSAAVASSRDAYGERLRAAGHGDIVTEVGEAGPFYYAEDYHQQYLAKGLVRAGGIPRERLAAWYRDESPLHAMATEGYCSMRGTGVSCPIGVGVDLDGEGDGAEPAT